MHACIKCPQWQGIWTQTRNRDVGSVPSLPSHPPIHSFLPFLPSWFLSTRSAQFSSVQSSSFASLALPASSASPYPTRPDSSRLGFVLVKVSGTAFRFYIFLLFMLLLPLFFFRFTSYFSIFYLILLLILFLTTTNSSSSIFIFIFFCIFIFVSVSHTHTKINTPGKKNLLSFFSFIHSFYVKEIQNQNKKNSRQQNKKKEETRQKKTKKKDERKEKRDEGRRMLDI